MESAPRPKRKAIPDSVKRQVILMQRAYCPHCEEHLEPADPIQYDHRPALARREVNPEGTDYIPPQLDPAFIHALHVDCHDKRTNGPGGEKRITTRGGDQGELAHDRKVVAATAAHAARMQAKGKEEGSKPDKPKRKIPSRPFPTGRKLRSSNRWPHSSRRPGA